MIRRLAATGGLVGLSLLVATCKLDDLVVPPTAGVLSVTPPQVLDSAPLGSAASHTATFSLSSGHPGSELSWTVARAQAGPWLAVTPGSGTTPSTVSITTSPAGLPLGSYRDTVILSATGAPSIRVSTEFRIHDCLVTPVGLDVPVTGALTSADCGAPHRSGRYAKVFSFAATAGDSVTASMSSGAFDAYLALDSITSGTPLSVNDNCGSTDTDACLRYVLLRDTRTYYVEATTSGTGQVGAFTLQVSHPRLPSVPDSLRQLRADSVTAIAVGSSADQTAVVLGAFVSDPDNDSVSVEVEAQPLGTGFSGLSPDAQLVVGTGFNGLATAISARVASGHRAVVRVPGLVDNTAYHWRARVVDQTGRRSAWVTFGGNSESAADFSLAVPEPPADPTGLAQFRADGVTPIAVGGAGVELTAVLKAVMSDPDPGDQVHLEVEVLPVGAPFAGTPTASSVPVATGETAQLAVAGSLDNVSYHWRARSVDQTGRASGWVAFGSNAESDVDFRIALPPVQLVFTVQPGDATAGALIGPPIRVMALDGAGHTVSSFTGSVSIALAANPGGGLLTGTTTVAAVGGVATFSALSIDRAASGYTLQATFASLIANSSGFNVSAGAATQLVFTAQPSPVAADVIMTPPVQVTARDVLGNTAAGYTGLVTLGLGSTGAGANLTGTTSSAVAGVATFSALSIDRAGSSYQLSASAAGLSAATSNPFDVSTGAVSLSRSLVIASASSVASGSGVTLTLQARDAAGNNLPGGGLTVAFTLTGGTSTGTIGSTTDNGNGTYTATFTGITAGTATTIGSTIGASAVTSALPTIVVTPGPVSTVQSTVTVNPPTILSGGVSTLRLLARDAAGNNQVTGGLTVVFSTSGGTSTGTIGTVSDNHDGTYSASFTGVLAGTATTVNATIGGLAVSSTLPTIAVTPEAASLAQSFVTVSASTVASGSPVTLTLRTRDAAGNNLTGGGLIVSFSASGGSATGSISGTTDNADGTYTATFTGILAGTATTIGATIGGAPITSALPAVAVTPGAASSATTIVTASSATVASGSAVTLTLHAFDAAGNALSVGGLTVAFGTSGGAGTSTGTISPASDQGNGRYTATFMGVVAGTATTIGATINGVVVTSAPPAITVTSGVLSTTTSVVTVSAPSVPSGNQVILTLGTKDAAGNNLVSGGLTVLFNVSGGTSTGSIGAVTDNGNGTYNASFTGVTAGSALAVGATIGGIAVTSGPPTVQVTAGNPSQLAWTTQPVNTAAGSAIATVRVAVLDAAGNPVTTAVDQVTVALGANPGGALLSGTLTVNAVGGVASFSNLILDRTGSGYTLVASASGLQGATSASFDVGAGLATRLLIVVRPSSAAQAGVDLAVQPVLQLQDANGNVVPQSGVLVNASVLSGPAGAALASATATTDVNGLAGFSNLRINGPVGTYTLNFAAAGLNGAGSNPIALSAGSGSNLVLLTQPSSTGPNGVPLPQQPVLQVEDDFNNPVATAGIEIKASIATGLGTLGGSTSVFTDVTGGAAYVDLTITGLVGTRTLGFSALSLAPTSSSIVNIVAGSATQMVLTAGDGQSATAATTVAVPPSVTVTDQSGNPVSNESVLFQVASGGGTVDPLVPVLTNTAGVASVVSWRLGPLAGTNTLEASAPGLAGSPVVFSATATVGAPASLVKSSGDNLTGPVGSTLATPLEVLITDAQGNPVQGVSVQWAAASGGGSVNPSFSNTDINGRTTTTRTLGAVTVGTQTTSATATLSGGSTTVIFSTTATVGGASQMTLAGGDGQTGQVGTTLPIPISVRVADSFNNPVPNVMVTWTIIGGGGLLSPATSVSNTSGIAGTNWTLGNTTVSQVASATAAGSPVNFVATATPGPVSASQSSLVSSAAAITASTGSSSATVTVTARDQFGNAISSALIGLTATGTANSFIQASPLTTNSSGVATATFSSTKAETKTLTATANSLALADQPVITVNAATANHLAFVTQPSDVASGASISPAVDVEILDVFTNRVSTTNGVTLALMGSPPGVTLSNAFAMASAGVASFPMLSVDKTGSGYTLSALAAGLTGATSGPFSVTPGAASPTQTTASVPAGTAGSATVITITVRDANGNIRTTSNDETSLAIAVGGANGANPVASSVGAGVYTATYTPNATGTDNIAVTLNGVAVSGSPLTSAVTAGAASATATTASVPAGTAGLATTITITVRDANNNIRTGSNDAALLSVGVTGANSASLTPTPSGSGTYTASYTPTVTGTDNLAITLNSAAIGGGPYASVVSAGVASPSQTTATAPAGTAGSTTTITITVRDANNNIRTANNDAAFLGVTVSGANAAILAATPAGSGTYTASYTPTVTGTDNLAITLNTVAIGGGPYASVVSAGAASAAHTTATVPAGTVGVATSVTITVRDANNNVRTAINDAALLSVAVTGANTATPSASSSGGGVYVASYIPTVTGTDNLAITLSGTPIGSSPLSSAVSPGTASAAMTTASVPAGTAGVATTIVITVRDASGNVRTATNDASLLGVAVTGANTASPTVISVGAGVYNATYVPAVAGTDNIAVGLSGAPVSNSPLSSLVSAGAASATMTTASAPAGTAGLATMITITVRDANGNVRTASNDAALLGVAVTGSNSANPIPSSIGAGVYSASYTPTIAGTDNIAVMLNGAAINGSPLSNVVSVGSASATASTASVPSGTAGSVTTITITVRDANNNIRTGSDDAALLSVTVSGANNAILTPTLAGSGTYTASYTPTVTGTDNLAITLSSAAIGGSPYASVVSAGAPSAATTTASVPGGTVGSATTITITVRDASNNIRTGSNDAALLSVTVSGANTAILTPTPAGGGTYTASYTPAVTGTDNVAITLSAGAIGGSPYASVVSAGAPSAATTTASVPAGVAGSTTTITIMVRDANDNIRSTFNDAGLLSVAITGANTATPTVGSLGGGIYSASYTPMLQGTDIVAIALSGSPIVGSTFTSIVSPGTATQLAFNAQPASTTGGATLAPVAVAIRDASGNTVTSATSSVTIALGLNPGAATLTGTLTVAAVNGVATFVDLQVDKPASGYTLVATSGTLASATSTTFDISVGPVARLGLSTQPSSTAQAGVSFAQQPVVRFQDLGGNQVNPGSGVLVTATIASGPSGATLVNATALSVNQGGGRATFSGLRIDGPVGTYTLAFNSAGLIGVISNPIALSPGAATQLVLTTQPGSTAQNGVVWTQQPVVQVADAFQNATPTSASVQAAIASGAGALGGTTTVPTNGSGTAAFTDLKITGATGDRTLSFSATSLTGVTSAVVSIGAGPATQLALQAGQGQTATVATTVSVPPTVIAKDQSANAVSGVSVLFQVASGGGIVDPVPPVLTDAFGIAVVTSWQLGPLTGSNSLTATATGLSGSPVTFNATAIAGAAASIAKSAGDGLTGPVGSTLGTPHEVLVTDAYGNPVQGVQVDWVAATGGGSVNPTSSSTDVGGHASTIRTLGQSTVGAQSTTATATVAGTPTTVTFSITATVGSPSQLTVQGGDAQSAQVGTTLPTPLSVRVADQYNNPVPGVTVNWTVTGGAGSVSSPTSLTNGSGIADIDWTLGPTTVAQTLSATGVASGVNFVATATPGSISGSQSTVVAVPGSITAGGSSTITVTVRDANSNPISGVAVQLTAAGMTVTQPVGTTDVNGEVTGGVSTNTAGVYTVSATVDGTVSITQTASVTVTPGAVSAGQSLVVAAPPSITAAGSSTITVTVRDGNSNPISGAAVQLTAASMTVSQPVGTTDVNGEVIGAVSATTAGSYNVSATVDGSVLVSQTASVTVTPGAVSPAQSLVVAASPSITAGGSSSITVTVQDANNNPISGAAVQLTAAGMTVTQPVGTTDVNGEATGSVSATAVGLYSVSATVDGTAAITQAASVTVTPGAVSVAQSLVSVGSGTVISGTGTTLTLQTKDAAGNNLTTDGLTVVFTLGGGSSIGTIGGVSYQGNGVYTAPFDGVIAGSPTTIEVTIEGNAVTSTLPTITVTPGAVSTAISEVSVGSGTVISGTGTTLTLQTKDAAGNNLTTGGLTVSFGLGTGTSTGTITPDPATDNGDGTYLATFDGLLVGTPTTITATIDGNAVTSALPTITVTP